MNQIKFKVEVKQGRIVWNNKLLDLWRQNLLNMGEGSYELIIRKPRKPMSDAQRGYYRGVVIETIHNETGEDREKIHRYCKYMFLPLDHNSTETMSTVEYEKYLEEIRVHFNMEFNIYIPKPNEDVTIDYGQ